MPKEELLRMTMMRAMRRRLIRKIGVCKTLRNDCVEVLRYNASNFILNSSF
jgi:hypothetical protein